MADPWVFVEARGDLAPGTAQTLLEAADRAGLPRMVVRSVYGGFDVPESLLEHLNEPEAPAPPPASENGATAERAPARSSPRKATTSHRRKR